jgi:hypothetical protein
MYGLVGDVMDILSNVAFAGTANIGEMSFPELIVKE